MQRGGVGSVSKVDGVNVNVVLIMYINKSPPGKSEYY